MDEFEVGCLSRLKRQIFSFSCCIGLNKIWSIKALAKSFVVVTLVIMPLTTIILDMFVSDTKVLLQLWQYGQQLERNASNITNSSLMDSGNETLSNRKTAANVSVSMFLVLFIVYMVSFLSLMLSPWLSSLITSYRTGMSLLEEDLHLSTPIGFDFFLQIRHE